MSKLFISDLHLEEKCPETADLFLKFLKDKACHAEALYILGDFFEIWIGDDDPCTFNQSIIRALKSATENGLPIYFQHGNRDFLIGKRFSKQTGCQLLPEEHKINLYGAPVLLMHGDSLCTGDVKYLKFRRKTRNYFVQKLFLWKSINTRRAIAKRYRELSQLHTHMAAENIMDVTQREVERVMQKHQVTQLIHGHTHRPDIHSFLLNGKTVTRTVLGAWHDSGNVLVCEPNGEQKFIML